MAANFFKYRLFYLIVISRRLFVAEKYLHKSLTFSRLCALLLTITLLNVHLLDHNASQFNMASLLIKKVNYKGIFIVTYCPPEHTEYLYK